ncbi:MAG: hypothetical protein M3362_20095 [Acidobacteriota bacterium]|nr:hypothetical protein [Acidobacteriota bacterium]
MDIAAKVKETVLEHIVLTAIGVMGLLFLIIWQSVDPAIWAWISDTTPKKVLWAWIGLAGMVVVLEGAYILHLRRKLRPKFVSHMGVLWDKQHKLYCPKDETLLFQSGRTGNVVGRGVEIFKCPKCDNESSFRNSDGLFIYYKDAEEQLRQK